MQILTISRLGHAFGLSRSTLLYYDQIGLLRASGRTRSGYRYYTDRERQRLDRICSLRQAGLALADIRIMLSTDAPRRVRIVEHRLRAIGIEIQKLQASQRLLTRLLRQLAVGGSPPVTGKERWIELMQAAGMNEAAMANWHAEFERRAPEEHHEFLRFLGISEAEIRQIRAWSQSSSRTSKKKKCPAPPQ